jgi:hypothetical protein
MELRICKPNTRLTLLKDTKTCRKIRPHDPVPDCKFTTVTFVDNLVLDAAGIEWLACKVLPRMTGMTQHELHIHRTVASMNEKMFG